MASTQELEQRREALKAAIAKGVRRIKFSTAPGVTQEIEYASLNDILAALAFVERELDPSGASAGSVKLARIDMRGS
jgi:hypothetical protein